MNTSPRYVLLVAIFLLILLSAGSVRYTATLNTAVPSQEDARSPARLTIPSIGVDAPVEYVGLAADGTMDVPKNPANVAWFSAGTRPGDVGSAVIDGHFGWRDGLPAAFDGLQKVRVGDLIHVRDREGVVTTFVVRETKTYREDESAARVFNSTDGKAHLNLITCEGAWNADTNSYSNRLVVFSDKL